ncbi:DUF3040 domain-containing protein [uncultured Jatrophihabitans sp.]|uniref:DUF3040 domain-containing protein n=1 Tax=uncultured Jatrophihabitans sp. TaxID=1610747 RepID=UPI0035CB2C77
MPLSEHEQRLLDEIEQALYAEDPKFAASVRSARRRSRTRRSLALCILGAIVGLGLVLVGLVFQIIVLSVIGFVMLVGSTGYGVQLLRGRDRSGTPDDVSSAQRPNNTPQRQSGLRNRMEDRLRKRFDEN